MSTKRKFPGALAMPVVKQSAKPLSSVKIDENRAAVSTGNSIHPHAEGAAGAIEISSDSSSDYDDLLDGEEADSSDEVEAEKPPSAQAKQVRSKDVDILMKDGVDQDDADASDAEPPTFGDLIRGSATVDVPASLAAQQSTSLSGPRTQQAATMGLTSLGTVLNQALRTDDTDLLETCLVINDSSMIQKTIDRLDSALAGVLLRKLTSRMHRRPGRAFGLMRWVQWTLVAHGGALSSQPDIIKDLSGLNRVLDERARGLPSLLALKGKLDMQDSQLKLHKLHRSAGQSRSKGMSDDDAEDSEEELDEEDVVYVENEENDPTNRANGVRRGLDAEDDFPVANGIDGDSEEDSDDENDDGSAIEAFAEESLDEDEVDHDDVESGEEDDSEADVPPSKVQKTARAFSKRK
ncbi:NUC189-domain-containing protein [Thozetella sp. PMI_491]|nr:NUC189-domain-containing protein [Thozetella sp. PMI_491]